MVAAQWIVLHAGETIECDKCREAVKIARRRGLIRKYNVPASIAYARMGNTTDHAYLILSLSTNGVIISRLCDEDLEWLHHMVELSFRSWHRGWQRPDVRRHLELMALANEPKEKVWQDWQQAIMVTALSGPEGSEGIWERTRT